MFLWRSHAKHADSTKAINHAARYVRVPIDLRRIEMLVQKLAKLGESSIQFGLLCRRNARIRHYPIGDEMSLEKALSKAEGLRAYKKQFLRLLNSLLWLRVDFIHSISPLKKQATHCSHACPPVQSCATDAPSNPPVICEFGSGSLRVEAFSCSPGWYRSR